MLEQKFCCLNQTNFTSFHFTPLLHSAIEFLSYLIFAVHMRECSGKHGFTSSSFPIDILNSYRKHVAFAHSVVNRSLAYFLLFI